MLDSGEVGGATVADAMLVGYRREDMAARFPRQLPTQYHADILGGKCISCGCGVYLRRSGADFLRGRDADLCCTICESRYDAEIMRSLT